MDQQEVEHRIKERFATLAPKLKEAIRGADVAKRLREITLRHKLHIDQGQQLENETFLVMLGLDVVEHYKGNIKKSLNISDELAGAIANDVQREIFLQIREDIKKSTIPEVPLENTYAIHANIPRASSEETLRAKTDSYATDPYREPPV
jgi:hypothetical protein